QRCGGARPRLACDNRQLPLGKLVAFLSLRAPAPWVISSHSSGFWDAMGASLLRVGRRAAMLQAALISFWLYITPPRVSAASAIVLVRRLINAAPPDLSDAERNALRTMRERAVAVQEIEKPRERLRPENLKDEDRLFDGYWGALKDQIFSW